MFVNYLKKSLICLILVLAVANYKVDANVRICGFKLTATLKALCRNQVCGGIMPEASKKRSIVDVALAMENEQVQPSVSLNPSRNWYLPNRSYGQFKEQPRKRMGIATNCCQKKCNLAYLRTFCCPRNDDE